MQTTTSRLPPSGGIFVCDFWLAALISGLDRQPDQIDSIFPVGREDRLNEMN